MKGLGELCEFFGVCLVSGKNSKGSHVRTVFIYRLELVLGDVFFLRAIKNIFKAESQDL